VNEGGVAKELDELGLPGRGVAEGNRPHRGYLGVVNQVSKKGRFAEQFDVEKVGPRLQRDRLQLLAPVQVTGRVNIDDRGCEREPPAQCAEPSPNASGPTTERMVGLVDGLQ
jgi:hypothetical protein